MKFNKKIFWNIDCDIYYTCFEFNDDLYYDIGKYWMGSGVPSEILERWEIGFVVALPTSLLVIPLAKRLADKLVSE